MRWIRLRSEAGRQLAEVRIGAFGLVTGDTRTDQAGEADQDQHDESRHRRARPAEAA